MDPLSNKPHFPPPTGPIRGQPTINPRRTLTPLRLCPKNLLIKPCIPFTSLPYASPSPYPPQTQKQTHTISVHVFPAAYPRAPTPSGGYDVPSLDTFKGNKDERKKYLKALGERMVRDKGEAESVFPKEEVGVSVREEGIWQCALRVRRNEDGEGPEKRRKGITLVTTHPIGFHKETWEPAFRHLIEMTERNDSSIRVEELWSLEAVNHGDTGLINESHIPKLPDRSDYGRDVANFAIHFLPPGSQSYGVDLPLELQPVSPAIIADRLEHGYAKEGDRLLVAVGHSLGGDGTALCGISYPKLFAALILIETTLFPPSNNNSGRKPAIVLSTLGRRSSWPNREEARKGFLKTPVFRPFDREALDAYLKYGLRDDPSTGEVVLKCNPAWEASEFTERRTMNEGWELLPTLDPSVEVRWIMGGLDEATNLVGGPENARYTVWRPRNTSNVKMSGGGHLVVQEKPREVAEEIARFLNYKFGSRAERAKL